MSGGPTEVPWSSGPQLAQICDDALGRAVALREQIRGLDAGSLQTLPAFNDMAQALDSAYGWSGLMFQVHPSEEVRNAARDCEQRLSKFQSEIYLDRDLYEALARAGTAGLAEGADRAKSKLVEEFERAGVDRDDATRKRLADIQEELVELSQVYQQNVREDVRSIRVKPDALEGLPADFVAAHPAGEDGLVQLTTDYPDFIPFETYSSNEPTRRDLYVAFVSRAYPANVDVLTKILKLREEYAKTLGYDTWAAYHAADKMVKTAARIESFLAELVTAAKPAVDHDRDVLLARKREDSADATAIQMWDRFYYVSKVREEQFAFDARDVRPYFPYEQVKQGILELYGELFGLRFVALPDAPVWHESVDAYALHADGREIGRFYLDMHPREGKFKHAAMFPMQTGLSTGRTPVAALVCNFPGPSESDAGLMEHTDVVTFFHEFGHLVHHLLGSGTPWMRLSGLNVEWDFVETPSQLLEEWAWTPEVLQRFAKHVDTGEPIPVEMVQRMKAADELGKGLHIMRQLYYTAFSYFLHTQDPNRLNLEQFAATIAREYSPFPIPPDAHIYANFGHLVGYSSAYYTYQWSLVMAKDLFTRFQAEGILSPAVAEAYRRAILEPGATKDAAELVEDFLGRPYSIDAYREWLTAPAVMP